jgi:hypothetical protein
VANEPRIVRLSADVGDPDLGVTVEYGYDTLGNLTEVTRTTPYAGFALNDARINRYTYTTDNPEDPYNLRRVTDPDGNVTEYVYYAPADPMAGYTVEFKMAKHEFVKEIRQPEGRDDPLRLHHQHEPGRAQPAAGERPAARRARHALHAQQLWRGGARRCAAGPYDPDDLVHRSAAASGVCSAATRSRAPRSTRWAGARSTATMRWATW